MAYVQFLSISQHSFLEINVIQLLLYQFGSWEHVQTGTKMHTEIHTHTNRMLSICLLQTIINTKKVSDDRKLI